MTHLSWLPLLVVALLACHNCCGRLNELKTVDDYMNICMLGMHHKSQPSEERGLTEKICRPWAAKSCCTEGTANDIHTDATWLNFDWNHCGSLSGTCREYFIMDSCFYSCSPNVGPWLVSDERKIRKERFREVPLCQSVCDRWWDACKSDLTCTDDWSANFNWSSGINTCPTGSECRPFREVFQNSASNFCEKVFGSFKVVPDEQDCFYLWFDPLLPNPNEGVARRRAAKILDVEYETKEGAKLSPHNKSSHLESNVCWLMMVMLASHRAGRLIGLARQ